MDVNWLGRCEQLLHTLAQFRDVVLHNVLQFKDSGSSEQGSEDRATGAMQSLALSGKHAQR
jgi:hypothetical protein